MLRRPKHSKSLSITKKVTGGLIALVAVLLLIGGSQPAHKSHAANIQLQPTSTSGQTQSNSNATTTEAAPQITTKSVTEIQAIPFSSTTQADASLAKGETKIITAGINGTETLTYKITLTNGRQTDKQLVGTVVTTPPVDQVTAIGTYVAPPPSHPFDTCQSGTYVNSSGNVVCRPYTAPTAPAGATAKCRDGSYSFSQHHSGTCSGHGGVAEWL